MRCFRIIAGVSLVLLILFCILAHPKELITKTGYETEEEFVSENIQLPDIPQGYSLERPDVSCEISLPLKNGKVSSLFGMRENPVSGEYKFHAGYDIAADNGDCIKCVMDGTVKKAGKDPGYGNYVIISHDNDIETLYAHMSEILTSEKKEIKKGEIIGKVGMTGSATGNHLHFELIINGIRYDPEWVLCGAYN